VGFLLASVIYAKVLSDRVPKAALRGGNEQAVNPSDLADWSSGLTTRRGRLTMP